MKIDSANIRFGYVTIAKDRIYLVLPFERIPMGKYIGTVTPIPGTDGLEINVESAHKGFAGKGTKYEVTAADTLCKITLPGYDRNRIDVALIGKYSIADVFVTDTPMGVSYRVVCRRNLTIGSKSGRMGHKKNATVGAPDSPVPSRDRLVELKTAIDAINRIKADVGEELELRVKDGVLSASLLLEF